MRKPKPRFIAVALTCASLVATPLLAVSCGSSATVADPAYVQTVRSLLEKRAVPAAGGQQLVDAYYWSRAIGLWLTSVVGRAHLDDNGEYVSGVDAFESLFFHFQELSDLQLSLEQKMALAPDLSLFLTALFDYASLYLFGLDGRIVVSLVRSAGPNREIAAVKLALAMGPKGVLTAAVAKFNKLFDDAAKNGKLLNGIVLTLFGFAVAGETEWPLALAANTSYDKLWDALADLLYPLLSRGFDGYSQPAKDGGLMLEAKGSNSWLCTLKWFYQGEELPALPYAAYEDGNKSGTVITMSFTVTLTG